MAFVSKQGKLTTKSPLSPLDCSLPHNCQWFLCKPHSTEAVLGSCTAGKHSLSPWRYDHDAMASFGKGNGQAPHHIPQAPRLAPRGDFRGDEDSVHGSVCLCICLLRLCLLLGALLLLDLHAKPTCQTNQRETTQTCLIGTFDTAHRAVVQRCIATQSTGPVRLFNSTLRMSKAFTGGFSISIRVGPDTDVALRC